jgi:hypothetical protein
MTLPARLRTALAVLGVGALTALLGASASRMLAPDAVARTGVPSVDPSQTLEPDFDSATARLAGSAGAALLSALRGHATATDTAIAIVLTAEDCLTCEDLGRQLRELRRATALPVVIAAESISAPVVATFLEREHLIAVPVVALPHASVLADGRRFSTPAAFIVALSTGDLAGISHTKRFKYARARSFRDELGFGGTEGQTSVRSRLTQEKAP